MSAATAATTSTPPSVVRTTIDPIRFVSPLTGKTGELFDVTNSQDDKSQDISFDI